MLTYADVCQKNRVRVEGLCSVLQRRLAGGHTSAYVMMLRMRLAEYCTQFFLPLTLSDLLNRLNVCVCVCACVRVSAYLPQATGYAALSHSCVYVSLSLCIYIQRCLATL